ncbi:hypothetical protein CISG_09027 [Coccidioides immitis RMSCC 3703]|uniref:Uncharacterized protein n=2 Tax=Coccidioides immitis TaxID=5501 RepID=A0A0J8R983_COCIT|nr:hypothetical protein CIRG_08791 [Coccidioides immitis RMSCC 2394]KMU81456.1 hypothetical protein CISG_09027 [Coccidioides immitis RMSCC 3703]
MDFLESSSFTNAPGHKCLPTPAEAIVRLLNCRTTPRLTAVKVEHLSLIVKLDPCVAALTESRTSRRRIHSSTQLSAATLYVPPDKPIPGPDGSFYLANCELSDRTASPSEREL